MRKRLLETPNDNVLRPNVPRFSICVHSCRATDPLNLLSIQGLEVLVRERRNGSIVHFRDGVNDFNRLFVVTLREEELGRFVEGKDDEAEEEDEHRDGAEGDHCISPSAV